MKGKIVMITGATSGVGEVSAHHLAKAEAEVVLVARNETKAKKTQQKIIEQSGNDKVNYILGDLSLMTEVRKVADEFKSKYDRLDVLMNNAGLVNGERKITSEGHEATIAINHYASFLLTHLLMSELENSGNARVINVASGAHKFGKLNLDDMTFENGFQTIKVYGGSKIAMISSTYEMARRYADKKVTFNTLHPGVVKTNFGEGVKKPGILVLIDKIFGMGITAEEGARTQIYLAESPEVEGVSGKYFIKSKEAKSSKQTHDRAFAERLWNVTREAVGLAAD